MLRACRLRTLYRHREGETTISSAKYNPGFHRMFAKGWFEMVGTLEWRISAAGIEALKVAMAEYERHGTLEFALLYRCQRTPSTKDR
jgi:hypothetical protein